MSNTTPRNLLDAAGRHLDATGAALYLRYSAHQIEAGFFSPDEWKWNLGQLSTVDGERRLQGNLANYLIANIEVTGRALRFDVPTIEGAALRVRLTFDGGDGEYTQTGAWMAV